MKIIETENLSYVYSDGTIALTDINLDINKGDRIAILGPNGAGKSTLLKIIAGLMFPYEGNVRILGETLTKNNKGNYQGSIGLLFQDPEDQIFMTNVWDDVAFGAINLDLDKKEIKKRVKQSLEHVELSGYEERVPHHLSFGEKKRVAIAGIIAMQPNVLLLDEPTANLDNKTREEFIKYINDLKTTVIVATHDVNTAIRLADKAIVLNNKILEYGSMIDIFSNDKLLKKAHLEAPTLMKLFFELKKNGMEFDDIPLSVSEAVNILKNKL